MYHFQPKPLKKKNAYQLTKQAQTLIQAKNLKQLAILFQIPIWKLKKIAENPKYFQFYIAKPNGGKRLIQTPNKFLKKLQKNISDDLQGVYFPITPPCSYGFIMDVEDATITKNIYTNALQHVHNEWIVNIDLKDFFHAIKKEKVEQLSLIHI